MKKVLAVFLVFALVTVVIALIWGAVDGGVSTKKPTVATRPPSSTGTNTTPSNGNSSTTSPAQSQTGTTSTTTKPPRNNNGGGGFVGRPGSFQNQPAVVTAAGDAMSQLSPALLFSGDQRNQIIQRWVAPTMVDDVEQAYAASAEPLASSWGYQNVVDAYYNSNYSTTVLSYKVVSSNSSNATVDLYTVTQYTEDKGKKEDQYYVPAITVVLMQNVNGSWLYAGTTSTPSDAQPSPQSGLSIAQTEARFAPYLKGFVAYGGSN
jgi:hypothetical protein